VRRDSRTDSNRQLAGPVADASRPPLHWRTLCWASTKQHSCSHGRKSRGSPLHYVAMALKPRFLKATAVPGRTAEERFEHAWTMEALLALQPPHWVMLVFVLGLGAVARLAAANVDGMHMDEALYAYYGRRVASGDVLLQHVAAPLPVFFWALGGTIRVLGETPLTIRIPDLAASLGILVCTYMLARDLAGLAAGALAGTLVAVSPFASLFGATVFLDPFTVGLACLGLLLALRGRPIAAGLALGLSVGGKLFALAYFPLAVVLMHQSRDYGARVIRLAVTYLAVVGLLVLAMWLRSALFHAPWFLSAQYADVGGTGIEAPSSWGQRAADWWLHVRYFFSAPIFTVVAAGALAALAAAATRRREGYLASAFACFCLGYAALLVAARSPVYDRYALYLLPPLCVAAAVGLAWLARSLGRLRSLALAAILVGITAASVPGIQAAASGQYDVGSRSDATYDGFPEFCAWLRSASGMQVIWSHSLRWHLLYCLDGTPAQSHWYRDASDISGRGSEIGLALTTYDDLQVVQALRASGGTVELERVFTDQGGQSRIWVYRLSESISAGAGP
jgi:Dolichyl-phosphate-mannose-protein mannosyltransferase